MRCAQGARQKETQAINASLSALGDVVASLAAAESHVPYRNSKLTHLLQRPLGTADSKVLMFINVSPFPGTLDETINSLRFASKVSAPITPCHAICCASDSLASNQWPWGIGVLTGRAARCVCVCVCVGCVESPAGVHGQTRRLRSRRQERGIAEATRSEPAGQQVECMQKESCFKGHFAQASSPSQRSDEGQ
jgi:hypothetical protein